MVVNVTLIWNGEMSRKGRDRDLNLFTHDIRSDRNDGSIVATIGKFGIAVKGFNEVFIENTLNLETMWKVRVCTRGFTPSTLLNGTLSRATGRHDWLKGKLRVKGTDKK
ncbi:hypothetical protein GOBAR_DD12207 [Gossypium barbadense]|nr:hypothetical protein GOBAR_DD12207 [Gossypium barbadense]